MSEMLDFYDSNMNLLGTETRDNVHKKGLWHKTIHCWLYDKQGNVYFQIRADANKLYTTASGHVSAGESIQDAFNREVKEEIGIDVKTKQLDLIQILVWQNKTPTKEDNVFANVYMCEIDNPEFLVDNVEVTGVVKVNAKECLQLISNTLDSIPAEKFTNDKKENIDIQTDDFLLMPNEMLLIKYGTILQSIIYKTSK